MVLLVAAVGVMTACCGLAPTRRGAGSAADRLPPPSAEIDGTAKDADPSEIGGVESTGVAADAGGSAPLDSWTLAGVEPDAADEPAVSITQFGALPDDGLADTEALVAALEEAAARPGPAIVDIPAGQFELDDTIILPEGVVLRGKGSTTRLVIDLDGRDGSGLEATGTAGSTWSALLVPPLRNGIEIRVPDPNRFAPGDHIEIEQDNSEAMYTRPEWRVDWGTSAVGELNQVESIDGNRIRLVSPLNADYSAERQPRARLIDPVEAIGIENLTLFRRDDGYGSSIRFQLAAEVWVVDVESERTSRAHIELDRVWRCRVGGSTFHGASDFGDGGRAYGISLARHTTGCLVVDNSLYDLRHAIIIQLGASGNVVAYNDARGSAGYADRQPRADLSLHGHWPQGNLFEGNVFDRVVSSDWWGPSGPTNTFHRNCVLDYLILADQSDGQVVLGNLIAPGGLRIEEGVAGTVLADNLIGGSEFFDQTEDVQPVDSLWRPDPPDFLDGYPWPVIGPETDGACRLPASARSAAANP